MSRPCIAGMATIRAREQSLREAVQSLLPQVSHLYVYLNDYDIKSPWMRTAEASSPVTFLLGKELSGDLGDAAKFFMMSDLAHGHFISVDDDLVYPPDFASRLCEWSARFGGRALCTTHGRKLGDTTTPIRGFFQDAHAQTRLFHIFSDVHAPAFVHFGGTGSMCFDVSKVQMSLDLEGREHNLADIWVGIRAQLCGVPIAVIPHTRDWIRQSEHAPVEGSIWGQTHRFDIPKHIINRELRSLTLHTCAEV